MKNIFVAILLVGGCVPSSLCAGIDLSKVDWTDEEGNPTAYLADVPQGTIDETMIKIYKIKDNEVESVRFMTGFAGKENCKRAINKLREIAKENYFYECQNTGRKVKYMKVKSKK
ncbi:MAG: hypothetical protein ACSHWU_11505 [Marinicella sp.]